MHPRNPYRTPPDFSALANAYPALKPHIILAANRTSAINFKNDAALRCLTQALLYRDFDINLSLPDNRLCPPVPSRLNYVLWIQDIIRASSLVALGQVGGNILVVDIGTGASAIYPLLGCKLEPKWRFIATEVDNQSIDSARLNVDQNGFHDQINVLQASPDDPIFIPLSMDSTASLDVTMCNPPFYSSVEDIARSAESKEFGPNAVCTGADVEMITAGGEAAFVSRMVVESLEYKNQCRWYTSMLGKLSSLFEVVALLRTYSIGNYAITEFVQGQTRRWAIAWSFGDVRLPDNLARISNAALQSIMPSRNTFRHPFSKILSPQQLLQTLKAVLQSIDGVSFQAVPPGGTEHAIALLASATQNTWSRSARRKKLSQPTQVSDNATFTPSETQTPALKCLIRCDNEEADHKERGALNLEVSWAQGKDRAIFESFWNHVCRKITDET